MKEKFIKFYMEVADSTSKLSSAVRLKVGSVIVKDNNILGYGYNGTPSGWDNVCEDKIWNVHDGDYVLKTKPEVLHSESNAILKVAKSNESTQGATMFCTHAPCLDCSKLIYQSGIRKLYYRDTYRDNAGLDFLSKSGVEVEQISK
jgi:dCMP deaminase